MKLSILTDNTAGSHFLAEHGLSYLIQVDGMNILFDTGHSDVFRQNASKLGIDLQQEVSLIVLSHGHWDHGNGLRFLQGKPLLTHPEAFIRRFRKKDRSPLGLALSYEEINQQFALTTSAKPYRISDRIFYLGEIPRTTPFESQSTPFEQENGADDFVPDDSALAIVNHGKLIVISGCAHSGICNICEYAKQVTGVQTIDAVIGGFHLKSQDEQTRQTIRYFEQENIRTLLPSHCTELAALAAFHAAFGIVQAKTGQIISFPSAGK
ncbi:MBL fold metallo-hydrolase [uncultured Sunxiuqinia sp.]|uniref:MBL fold metallo-hydrolase n=1 Tax=uncultured Sunxiuqinia sp. TaxID=1573825 RepID=UPI00261A62BB|nr:MBL fold metallo-hydrolase [uncultured Sunxiuqinia sp.]